jgi:hypothetical protein
VTLVSDVIGQARRHFMATQRDRYQTLSADCTATATTITVTYDTAAQQTAVIAGTTLEIGIESMLVTAVSSTALTVIRGFNSSTKTAHKSGDLIKLNPVLLDFELFNAINNELRDLSSPGVGLFQVDTYEFTPSGNIGYDLPLPLRSIATILEVFAVQWQEPQKDWRRVYHWKFQRATNTSDFPSGFGLMFKGTVESGRIHRVFYKAGFVPFDAITDDVSSSGLMDEAIDVLAMGAAIRASESREISRSFFERQGDTRRPSETPPGSQLQGASALRAHYMMRRSAERSRLHKLWLREAA